mgnify:CR=1 FL=1
MEVELAVGLQAHRLGDEFEHAPSPCPRPSICMVCRAVAPIHHVLTVDMNSLSLNLSTLLVFDVSVLLSSKKRGVHTVRLILFLSVFERRYIHPGRQMLLAPFLEKSSLDRAPGRFAEFLIAPHAKANVLLTMVVCPLHSRRGASPAGPGPDN